MRSWIKELLFPVAIVAFLAIIVFVWQQPESEAQPTAIGPANPILCNQLLQASITGTGASITTSLQAGNPNQTIVICGWHNTNTGTTQGTFQLEYGTTGGPCTTPTTLTPAFGVGTTPTSDPGTYARFSIPKGSQLCVVTTGAATAILQIGVWAATLQ